MLDLLHRHIILKYAHYIVLGHVAHPVLLDSSNAIVTLGHGWLELL